MSTALVGEVVAAHTLAENEAVIRTKLTSFIEVGNALREIRDEGQYIDAGFDTFEDYCKERWSMARKTAYAQIDAARVAAVCTRVHITPPEYEFHVRPLLPILNEDGEEAVVAAWTQVVEEHKGDEPITGREVKRFFQVKRQANYGTKAGWHELIGTVGDELNKAATALAKFETALGSKDAGTTRAKAKRYAAVAEDIAARLRVIGAA